MGVKKIFGRLGLYVLVVLAYFIIFSSVFYSSYEALIEGASELLVIPIFVILSALYIFASWKWYQKNLKLEVRKTKLLSSIWLPIILLIAFIFFQLLAPIQRSTNQSSVELLIDFQPIFAFLYVVVFAPIVEELLTRGFLAKFLFPKQESYWQILLYILVSSSLFSLLHLPVTLVQFLTYFIMGVIFTLGYLSKKDLRYAIALHMANNLIAFVLFVFF